MSLLDTDQQVQQLAMGAVLKGAKPTHNGDSVIYPIEDVYLSLDHAKLLVSKGAKVDNMSLFIEIDSPSSRVPDSLILEVSEDEEPKDTWATWLLPNHNIMTRAGRLFVGTNGSTNQDPSLNELVDVFDDLITPYDLPVPDPELN